MPTRQDRATMRDATEDEVDRVYKFYLDANVPNVLPRSKEDYYEAARDGVFYIIESNEQIIAAAGIFPLVENPASVWEIGSAYVVEQMRGFKLQQLLLKARMAAAWLFLDAVDPKLIAGIKPANEASIHNILKVGFVPWPDLIPEVFKPCTRCTSPPHPSSGRKCCCDFYILPKAQICEAASSLLQNELWYQKHRSGAELAVECKPRFLTNKSHRSKLRELVEEFRQNHPVTPWNG